MVIRVPDHSLMILGFSIRLLDIKIKYTLGIFFIYIF